MSQSRGSDHQGQTVVPLPVEPTRAPTLVMDPAFIEQLVRAVRACMSDTIAPVAPTFIDSGGCCSLAGKKREINGCEPFLGEQDIEATGMWIRKSREDICLDSSA